MAPFGSPNEKKERESVPKQPVLFDETTERHSMRGRVAYVRFISK